MIVKGEMGLQTPSWIFVVLKQKAFLWFKTYLLIERGLVIQYLEI